MNGQIMPERCTFCIHEATIAKLAQKDDHLQMTLDALTADIKGLGAIRVDIQNLQMQLEVFFKTAQMSKEYEKAEFTRMSERVAATEAVTKQTSVYVNELQGMAKLLRVLWLILTSGLGVILFRMFNGGH